MFSERGNNEKILLRNLASIYIQQKANFVSCYCKLYRLVLSRSGLFHSFGRSFLNGLLYINRKLKYLTKSAHQIKLIKANPPIIGSCVINAT